MTATHPVDHTLDLVDGPVIRPALPEEIEVVKDLVLAVGLSHDRALLTVTSERSTYWLALAGGRAIGCIGLEHGEGASLLRSAAVLEEARGGGVGRALAESALTLATLRGDRAVYLFSTGAGAYWKRFGFEQATTDDLAAALPDVPQVVSGLTRGWIAEEVAWKKTLAEAQRAHA